MLKDYLADYLNTKLTALLTVRGYTAKVYMEVNYKKTYPKGEISFLVAEGTVNQTDPTSKIYNEAVNLYCWTEKDSTVSNTLKTSGFDVAYNLILSLFLEINMTQADFGDYRVRFVFNAPTVLDIDLPITNGYECRLYMQGILYFFEKNEISLNPSYSISYDGNTYEVELLDPSISNEVSGVNEESAGKGITYPNFYNQQVSFSMYLKNNNLSFDLMEDIRNNFHKVYSITESYLKNYYKTSVLTLTANSDLGLIIGAYVSDVRSAPVLPDVEPLDKIIGVPVDLNGYTLSISSQATLSVYDTINDVYYVAGDIVEMSDNDILVCLAGGYDKWEIRSASYNPNHTYSNLKMLKGTKALDTLTGLTLLTVIMGASNGE